MATAKPKDFSETDKKTPLPVPRLERLIIRNFRNIGSESVVINCHDIVLLAGYQTSNDSSISTAYKVIMYHAPAQPPLAIEDFHNGLVDKENLPEAELHSILHEEGIDTQWLDKFKDGEFLYKEKWIWENPGLPPAHYVYNTKTNKWTLLDSIKPHELNPQDDSITLSLLAIMDRTSGIQQHKDAKAPGQQNLVEKLKQLQNETIKEYKNRLDL